MPGDFEDVTPVRGPKLMIQLTWGCLIFFAVMFLGTYGIGNYFLVRIKKHNEMLNAKADQQLMRSKAKSSQSTIKPELETPKSQ